MKAVASVTMLKIPFVLCCALPAIIGVPLAEQQHESNEISAYHFDDSVPDPKQLAEQAGYVAETHEIVTEDRYVLQLFRIAGSKDNPPSAGKPVVLLLHGLLDSAASWLIAGPEKGLGFMLANRGYDVWLGNARGNRYSRRHLDFTVSDPEYWLFSWHEIGKYDLPAMIDRILQQTKQEKILYMGHSQGGTAFFILASERPEYQEKITAAYTLAPAVFMDKIKHPVIRALAPFSNNIKMMAELIGVHEFKPSGKLIHKLAKELCDEDALTQPLCANIIFLMNGGRDKDLNMTLVPTIVQYDPAGSSVRQFLHFAQSINSGKFRQYDHGLFGNMKKYGKIHPPDYNIASIKIPVYLYYSSNDMLVSSENTRQLYRMLPNAEEFSVPSKSFTHLDFLWGKHADMWVYNKIFSLMERRNK